MTFVLKKCGSFKFIAFILIEVCLILLNDYLGDHTADLFPFFALGYSIANKKQAIVYLNKYRYIIYLFFLILILFFKDYYLVYVSGINPFSSSYGVLNQIMYNLYRFLAGAFGSITIITFVKNCTRCPLHLQNYFSVLGAHTLQIYVMQSLLLEGVVSHFARGFICDGGYLVINLIAFVLSIIYTFLFLIAIKAIELTPKLRFILFGKRVIIAAPSNKRSNFPSRG